MVIAADVVGVLQVFAVAHAVEAREHFAAPDRVGLHDLVFVRRQPAGFVQNGVRYRDLANVVQRGGAEDNGDRAVVEQIFGVTVGDVLEQDPGEDANTLDMLAGFDTAIFNDG